MPLDIELNDDGEEFEDLDSKKEHHISQFTKF